MWQPGITLEQVEKEVILLAFKFYRGNKTETAKALDIAIRTLDNKLKQYNQKESDDAILSTSAGVHTESVPEDAEEQPMPVRERQEVQKVSSTKDGIRHQHGRH